MTPDKAPACCASCGQPLHGRFCSSCGEEVLDSHLLTVRHFFTHTLVHELLEVDGKIFRTLRHLVVHPGFLAEEYAAGRRRRYINPLRLLLTAILLYAFLTRGGLQVSLYLAGITLSVAPTAFPEGTSIEGTVERIDRFGLLGKLLAEKRKSVDIEAEVVRERFHQHLEKFAEPLSFANVLMLAMALFVLFRWRRHLFVEHAAFSMHFVSFVLFSSLFFAAAPPLMRQGWQGIVLPVILVGVIWQFTYLAVAIRRFYLGQDRRSIRPVLLATVAAALVYVLNSVFITAVQLAGGALAILRLAPS